MIVKGAIRKSFLSSHRKWAGHLFEDTDGIGGGQVELTSDISAITLTFLLAALDLAHVDRHTLG